MINEVKNTRFKKAVQNITYMPYFVSTVVLVGMINLFFSYNGLANNIGALFGAEPQMFLMKDALFNDLYVWSGVWQATGYGAVIYIAALAGVSPDLHEAATIDGATRLQRIIHINLPAIMPTIVIMLIMAVGGIMNGTTNFIMDAMARQGADFPAVLQRAQELGYAEADPSADIDGDDIRRKLTISANIAFDALLREEDIPAFGIRTVTGADVKDFRAHGFTCKLLACAQRTETGVAAYVEPALVAEGEPEAAVPGNYNLISCTGELLGRQSYFGQGAGRYPTAANVVQDCLDLLTGEDGFYTETARPMAVEADAVAHPYYVRTQAADPWLKSVTADRWDSGVITGAVPVGQMLRWAAAQRQRDPGCFVAGIR